MYKYNGSQFLFIEDFSHSSDGINSLDISNDGMYMAFAPISTDIHIYRYNGIDYNHFQTLTFANSATRNIEFNRYNELMIADTYDFRSYLYKYNEDTLTFN